MVSGCADEDLTIIVSDIHVGGRTGDSPYPLRRLNRFVDEVLAMNPRPKRVVILGDLAYLYGLPEDYAVSKPVLQRFEDVGIELVFCMGNHDRRNAFAKAWPGHVELSPVPGRFVRVVSLGTADLVVLDCLQGSDNRSCDDKGPGAGKLHADVWAWCERSLPKMERPFLVCSHFPVEELKLPGRKNVGFAAWLLKEVPMCKGYIHGHKHKWCPGWSIGQWTEPRILRTLCLPANGLWGDIGYATLLTLADRVVCSLEIRDFFFPREPETSARPVTWRVRVEEIRGQKVSFPYDLGGGRL